MDATAKMTAARVALVLDQPFFGVLALRLRLQADPGCGSAWVDGRTLGYDPAFIERLGPKQVVAVVAHEVMHCFPAGTLVAGDDKPIESFAIGDQVLGRSGAKCRIVATSKRSYTGELVTIRGRGLLPVDMTSEHPVLVSRARWVQDVGQRRGPRGASKYLPGRRGHRLFSEPCWIPARDVAVGDWLHVPRIEGRDDVPTLPMEFGNAWSVPPETRRGITLDAEVAEFLGWYVAEGWASKRKDGGYQIGLALNSTTERPVAERLREIVRRRFGYSARIYERSDAHCLYVAFDSAPLGRFLRATCGTGASNKRIPEAILYHKDAEVLRSFLRGYVAGDGHSAGKFVGFGTASKTLALQVQLAFARFGALINLYERAPSQAVIRGSIVESGIIYIGQGRSQAVFDALSIARITARPTRYWGEQEHCLLTPVRSVSTRSWSGDVYNFETEDHTYTAGNIVTHNCAMGHPWRRDARKRWRWNVACDRAVNPILRDAGFTLPEGALYELDRSHAGKSAEWIYARLPEPPQQPQGMRGAPGSGGPGPGSPGGPLDEVRDAPPEAAAEGLTQAEWETAVQQAANAAQMAGKLPASLQRFAAQAARSSVDWRSVLRRFVQQVSSADYSWRTPNQRYLPGGLYMPSLRSEQLGPIAVAVDTSGSIDAVTLGQFEAELRSVVDDAQPASVSVIYCDARVHRVDSYGPGDLVELQAIGGGGTDFRPALKALDDLDEQPVCLIYLTDLQGRFPTQAPELPVLWAATTTLTAPFGETVYLST